MVTLPGVARRRASCEPRANLVDPPPLRAPERDGARVAVAADEILDASQVPELRAAARVAGPPLICSCEGPCVLSSAAVTSADGDDVLSQAREDKGAPSPLGLLPTEPAVELHDC